MTETRTTTTIAEIKASGVPVINEDDAKANVFFNQYRGYLLRGLSGTICLIWQTSIDEALNEACDLGYLGQFALDAETAEQWDRDGWKYAQLGNFGEPADLTYLNYEVFEVVKP